MKKSMIVLVALAVAFGCGSDSDDTNTSTTDNTNPSVGDGVGGVAGECAVLTDESAWTQLNKIIDTDTTLTCDKVYTLQGLTFITNGATLTIEAGTTVLGGEGTALIATQDGKLVTNGTATAPVVLTSINAVSANPRSAGDWGGVVLLGNAPINVSGGTNLIEGIDVSNPDVPENGSRYGGTDSAYNCGSLTYTRVEFAGFELTEGNELNGVTLGGCGTETSINYLQVHEGLDDGVEIFGGAPNLKYLVLSNIEDDSLDWDQGFTGKIQFMLVQQKDNDADNGIEADNDEDNHDAMPRSNPTLANLTMIGSEAGSHGLVLRRGTLANISNALVTNFPKFGLDIRDEPAVAALMSGEMTITNSLFFNNGEEGIEDDLAGAEEGDKDDDSSLNEAEFFSAEALANQVGVDPSLSGFIPSQDSVVVEAGALEADEFFTATTFIGAFDPAGDDWTAGWTNFVSE